jgi:UDP-N-acetylmuramyl pentapeptide phosphotransferase/UDP-N-acetylglucosamine-1-phosphate transferase
MGASMAAVLAFLISALLTRRICNPASRLHVLDHPNDRSLHTRATPRTGGVAILAGVLAGFVLLALWTETRNFPLWLVLGAAIMAALSFADDRRGLSVRVRLLGHLTSAGIVVASGLVQPFISLPGVMWEWPVWLGTIFSLLFLIWMANLYNFMDGMDGFAGGMAVIGFGTFGVLREWAVYGAESGHCRRRRWFSAVQFSTSTPVHGRCRLLGVGPAGGSVLPVGRSRRRVPLLDSRAGLLALRCRRNSYLDSPHPAR